MTSTEIEKRLTALDAEVASLKSTKSPQDNWWDKIAGVFADNPRFGKAMGVEKWHTSSRSKSRRSAARARVKRKTAK
jgi:hypothetical protein